MTTSLTAPLTLASVARAIRTRRHLDALITWPEAVAMLDRRVRILGIEANDARAVATGRVRWLAAPYHGIGLVDPQGRCPYQIIGRQRETVIVLEKRRCGFATQSKDAIRAAASRGGKQAHASGHARHWTEATAKEAGREGGIMKAHKRALAARAT